MREVRYAEIKAVIAHSRGTIPALISPVLHRISLGSDVALNWNFVGEQACQDPGFASVGHARCGQPLRRDSGRVRGVRQTGREKDGDRPDRAGEGRRESPTRMRGRSQPVVIYS